MSDLELAVPVGLAAPYSVPQADWVAIDNRVTLVIEVQQIASVVEQYIPNYPDLLSVCTAWRQVTFPDLIAQAVTTNLFATKAAQILGSLSTDLAGLTPSDPVPDAVKFIIGVQLKALAESAGQEATASVGLEQATAAFVTANRTADAALEQRPLDGWSSITGSISSLEGAMADVQQSWGAISTQLTAASDSQTQITTAELLSIDLQTAIAGWTGLADAAAAFDSEIAGLHSGSAA